jgi:hypothetical protein
LRVNQQSVEPHGEEERHCRQSSRVMDKELRADQWRAVRTFKRANNATNQPGIIIASLARSLARSRLTHLLECVEECPEGGRGRDKT